MIDRREVRRIARMMIDRREVRRIARMMREAVKLDRAYSIRAISQATKPDFQTSGSIFKTERLD